jgi:hypothetical protein
MHTRLPKNEVRPIATPSAAAAAAVISSVSKRVHVFMIRHSNPAQPAAG